MLTIRLSLFLMTWTLTVWSQSPSDPRIYTELSPYSTFFFGEPIDYGYQFITGTRVITGDQYIPPGLLIHMGHSGDILYIDTLREYSYNFAHRVDSILFLSSAHYYKNPDTLSTFVFEICDLRGNIIQSFSHDFVQNIPYGAGVTQKNDSILIFAQGCVFTTEDPGIVFYEVNIHSLEVQKRLAFKGGIIGEIPRIDDEPTFLEWIGDIWIKDTTFTHTTKVYTDTTNASQLGTILPREDKPGWFGFGGCSTPTNFYGICMIALDENLTLDKVDLIYHPPSGSSFYSSAPGQSICKSGDAYYGAGIWDFISNYPYAFIDTFPEEMVIVKYDVGLNRQWTKVIGGERRYRPQLVQPKLQGGFMLAGVLRDNLDDYKIAPFTMFFDADGDLVGTQAPTPGRYEFTIYGNPGREALRIMSRFEGRKVLLQVVNAMGQPMLHRYMTEGMNEFDTSYWPSGTYLMSITDDRGEVLWSQPWIRVN